MPDASTFLVTRQLRKEFPGAVAVDDVSLTVGSGEIVGLVGQNGAGKSTLIRLLAGALRPDGGEIIVDGQPAHLTSTEAARRLGFAFVHQELDDFQGLSVAENVAIGAGLPRRGGVFVNWRALRDRVRATIETLRLETDPETSITTLTTAERRLVTIAAALYGDARLIVLDEPTASLSRPETSQLHEILRRLRARGIAVIYISHRLDEVVSLCNRTLVMRDGRLVGESRAANTSSRQLLELITGRAAGSEAVGAAGGGHADRPAGASEELLKVDALSREPTVAGVSFSVAAGEVLGLGGLVGSGRTELVRLIAGADRPTSGSILIRGKEVTLRSPGDALEHGISLLPEDRRNQGLIQSFRVRENITLATMWKARRTARLPLPSRRRERLIADDYLRRLQVAARSSDQPTNTLSGGSQQKVLLSRGLLRESDVFIFDEPTLGVDVGAKEEIFAEIRTLANDGRGVIVISSELEDLGRVCDRVIVMREGHAVAELKSEEITEEAILVECYGGTAKQHHVGVRGVMSSHVD